MTEISSDGVMVDLQGRVRERLRAELLQHGASPALGDADVYTAVDRVLREAVDRSGPRALLLPDLLGDPGTWRLETSMRYQSHRGRAGSVIVWVKRRVLMPILRFLFDYSRENFDRQQRVNLVLFACVQELAIENATLRRELQSRD